MLKHNHLCLLHLKIPCRVLCPDEKWLSFLGSKLWQNKCIRRVGHKLTLIRLSKYLHAWTARKSNLKCVKLTLQLLWSNVKHSMLGLNDWEDWQSFEIRYQSFSQCDHCFPQWTPHHTLELSTSRRRLNTSQLAAFSLLSLCLYKLFQCNGIILSFFLLQFLCITKAQGRIFTMKTWALCIMRPALCFSTQDWSCKVYVSLTNILTPKIWLAIFLFNFYVCSCRSVTRNRS